MNRVGACVLGAVIFFLLSAAALRHCFPSLPEPLRLEARFDPAVAGANDPIALTGIFGAADFLYVRRVDADTAVFGYDHWGAGGPVSSPVKLAPGVPHRLEIVMPSLGPLDNNPSMRTGTLRVSCDGAVILEGQVPFHWRTDEQVFLGTNPIAGSSCGPEFHGTLRGPDGRVLRGGPRELFSLSQRLAGFRNDGWWRIWPLLFVSAALVWGAEKLARFRRSASPSPWPWGAIAAGAVSLLGFAYCISDGGFHLIYPESFGAFYDYQAFSLLHGHLDVPRVALGEEAFLYHGKSYGYFGMTPALMRIPFVVLNLGFGELSRSFMCADFLACLVFSYLILRHAIRLRRGNDATPSRWVGFLFVAAAGIGSPLFFLAGRAYVYHEAIVCGAAFALAGGYCTLGYISQPARRWWLGALVCGLLSVQARPSSGLFALTFTGCAALAQVIAKRKRSPWRDLLVGAACVLGVFSFNAVSYLKFHTFDGAPLKYHVQYDAARLDRIEGRNFHLVNVSFNLEAYLIAPTFRFLPRFPFLVATGRAPLRRRGLTTGIAAIDRALDLTGPKMDLIDPMLGLPYAVPGLCLLALFGAGCARKSRPEIRQTTALLWASVIPFALAMFAAVATAERYTADFCPFLLTAAALGLAAVEGSRRRTAALAGWATLTLWSVFAMVALTLHYEGTEVWGVPDEAKKNYEMLSQRVDRFLHLSDHDSP